MTQTDLPVIPLPNLNCDHCILFVAGMCQWRGEERKTKEYCAQIWKHYKE